MKKRGLSWCVIVALCMLMFSTVTVGADEPNDFSEHLVTHWDFEGESPYQDKATMGKSLDTLVPNGDVSVKDGVVTISNTFESYMTAAGRGDSNDLHSFQNKTIIMKLMVNDIDPSYAHSSTPIIKGASFQVSFELFDEGDMQSPSDVHFRVWDGSGSSDDRITNVGGVDTYNWTGADGKFHYVILSFSYDSETEMLTQSYYFSTDAYPKSIDDFSLLFSDVLPASGNVLTSNSSLMLGKSKAAETIRRAGYSFDDIKIYDVAMTIEQAYNTLNINFDEDLADAKDEAETEEDVYIPYKDKVNKETAAESTKESAPSQTDDDAPNGKFGCTSAFPAPILLLAMLSLGAVLICNPKKQKQK